MSSQHRCGFKYEGYRLSCRVRNGISKINQAVGVPPDFIVALDVIFISAEWVFAFQPRLAFPVRIRCGIASLPYARIPQLPPEIVPALPDLRLLRSLTEQCYADRR